MPNSKILNSIVIVASLGYFVDIYDLLLFGIVRSDSLKSLGFAGEAIQRQGEFLISMQMFGMLLGGILWGILGDKKGRLSVLFGSILLYSTANILNGMVVNVDQYALCRFFSGIGLAGELGAGITLISETLSKEKRGYGTMFMASVGLSGAIFAYLIYQFIQDWRLCYYIGGGLGISLLLLRIKTAESKMFTETIESTEKKGDFLSLFRNKKRFSKYAWCTLAGIQTWLNGGLLITFSPEFAAALNIENFKTVTAGETIALFYIGLVLGDIVSGLLSQWAKNRNYIMCLFLILNGIAIFVYLNAYGASKTQFYWICSLLGFTSGYWVLFATIAAEQFGTNIRVTVATTVPNFIRGFLPLIILGFHFFRDYIFDGNILKAGMLITVILVTVGVFSLLRLKETFDIDLNFVEKND